MNGQGCDLARKGRGNGVIDIIMNIVFASCRVVTNLELQEILFIILLFFVCLC